MYNKIHVDSCFRGCLLWTPFAVGIKKLCVEWGTPLVSVGCSPGLLHLSCVPSGIRGQAASDLYQDTTYTLLHATVMSSCPANLACLLNHLKYLFNIKKNGFRPHVCQPDSPDYSQ